MNLRTIFNTRTPLALVGLLAATSAFGQSSADLARIAEAKWDSSYNRAMSWAALTGTPTEIRTASGTLQRLVGMDNGRPTYFSTLDINQVRSISAEKVWPGGSAGTDLTGAPIVIGIWDDGIVNHAEFQGRVIQGETSGDAQHGNMCASTMSAAGLNPQAKGIAYASTVLSYDAFNGDIAEMTTEAANGLKISNHSYGRVNGWAFGMLGDGKWVWMGDPTLSETLDATMGYYGTRAAQRDDLSFINPNYLQFWASANQRMEGPGTQPVDHWVFSGGNWTNSTTVRELDGGPNGYDSIPPEQCIKNGVVVGATLLQPGGYSGPGSVVMSDFSCWGPADDGRIKPDLVTPGVNIFGTYGQTYTNADGTSFASPGAAAGAALMVERFQQVRGSTPRGATIHGLAIHTCDEAGPNPGPDYMFGWGLMNVDSACSLITQSAFNSEWLQELTIQNGQTIDIPVAVGTGGPFKVTICWHEPASTPLPLALNNRTPLLVNDLDLRVIKQSNGTVFTPWLLNPDSPAAAATQGDNKVDNVEQVYIANPSGGVHTVRITHKGANLKPAGSQQVSVIISGPIAGGIESLTLDPTTVVGGLQNSFATVTLSATKATDSVINLSSNNPTVASVPLSVTIPAGSLSANFDVVTSAVSGTTNVTILAGGSVGTASARLTVRPVGLTDPLTVWPGRLPSGNYATGYVNLNGPAPAGGASVYLTSSDPTYAEPVNNWILIPEGQTQARFSIRSRPVTLQRTLYIRASRAGTMISNDLTLLPAALTSVTTVASSFRGTGTLRGTVRIDAPAPNTGAVIQLRSSNTSAATVPATVVIPPGYKTADFTIRGVPVSSATSVTITATRSTVSKTVNVTVLP